MQRNSAAIIKANAWPPFAINCKKAKATAQNVDDGTRAPLSPN
jgi:hypothetical protein